jgi:hypothetical protein
MPFESHIAADAPGVTVSRVETETGSTQVSEEEIVTAAPVWLQRMSLFVLVLFCVYLGVLVMILPWWTRMWDQNELILAHPAVAAVLQMGAVRGFISGLGLLDIWIGVSEAIHYRDHRA